MKKIFFISIILFFILNITYANDIQKNNASNAMTSIFCSSKMALNCYSVTNELCKKTLPFLIEECFIQEDENITKALNKMQVLGQCVGKKYFKKFQTQADEKCVKLEAKNMQKAKH